MISNMPPSLQKSFDKEEKALTQLTTLIAEYLECAERADSVYKKKELQLREKEHRSFNKENRSTKIN